MMNWRLSKKKELNKIYTKNEKMIKLEGLIDDQMSYYITKND